MPGFSAMVLAAGYGTRLRPLTDELPKPLVPIGDRPLLAHVARRLVTAGARVLALNCHHLPEQFRPVIENLGVTFEVFFEPEIRGTAGGVAGARDVLAPGPCVVHNGDILTDAPYDELIARATAEGLCLLVAPRPKGEGTVGMDAQGRLVRLRGESFGLEVGGGDYTGILALDDSALAALPDRGCLIGDVVLPRLRAGGSVPVTWLDRPWSDVGDPSAYLLENMRWLGERGLAHTGWVGEGAVVSRGVRCEASVVGAGAHIEGSGVLRRAVVWPGARARAPLASCIVTARGVVVPVGDRATPAP